MKRTISLGNILGDQRAEADSEMLDRAFIETADFRTLIETSDRVVVVGRRGTGKSALARAVEKYWRDANMPVIRVAPEEYEVIGLRPLVGTFGNRFSIIRAAMRLFWRYALMLETALALQTRPGFSSVASYGVLKPHMNSWEKRGSSVPERIRQLMKEMTKAQATPEDRIGDLPHTLHLAGLESGLADACASIKISVVFLIDKLDEGYEPDLIGVGLVDGLVQAAIDIKTRIQNVRPILLLRDNIFRAIQSLDHDYSRNVDQQVLRLHWDETALLDFAAARLGVVFKLEKDSSHKIWNACTGEDLRGREGFVRCLRLTLYRPRDVLALLNYAFYVAQRDEQSHLSWIHVERTAHLISQPDSMI